MSAQQKQTRRLWRRLQAGVICLALAGTVLGMSSCQILETGETDGSQDTLTATQKDAYEAKIVYYEAQIQTLNTQLGEIEQQFYVMRNEYMDQVALLEQQLSSLSQTGQGGSTTAPDAAPDSGTDDTTVTEQDTEQTPDSETDNTATDAPSGGTQTPADTEEITLCEYTYRLERGFAILTKYLGTDADVIIPAAVDGHLVIGLGDSVFADCAVKSVKVPATVKTLGWFTFYQCKNLETVILPAGVTEIGYASFDGCPASLYLTVESGSYAEQYAISFGLKYQTKRNLT